MITDDFLMYLLFQIIILAINILGIRKVPMLLLFGLIASIIMAVPTITAFGEYYMMAIVLVLINTVTPIIGFTKSMR